jgi:Ca2+-binding RTX toxin-like protein
VALTDDTGSSNSDNITSNAALTVSAAAADVTRTYTIDGGALSASYAAPTADGAHTVVVTDTNAAGSTATTSINFTLDTTIATPTTVLTSDTGSSNSDNITSNAALTVSAAAADVTRIYTIDGGLASASYTAPTTDGAHTVVVTDTDTAGNTANASISFTLDNTIATPTVMLTSDTGSSSSDNITQNAALSLSSAAADVTRTYTVDGGLASASYTAPTTDGAHTVVVTDTDAAGNLANASLSFTLDNTIATPMVALTNDTGSSNSDNITSDATLTVSAAAADVTRTYTVDGGLASASYTAPTADGAHTVLVTDTDAAGNTANAGLSFTLQNAIATPTVALTDDTGSSNSDNITSNAALTVSAAAADVTRIYTIDGGALSASYAAPTADGAHTVVVTDTDAAGNLANASLSFTLDNTIATPTVALTSDTGSSNSDGVTSNAALTVSAAAADVTRTYTVDGGALSASYTAPTADGAHTVVITDTDTAGNTANASLSFTLENAIATPTLILTNDTGSSSSDNITQDAALTVSAAAADVTRTYTVDGGLASASYIAPTADGAHTVVVNDISTAGSTATASISFTLDNTIATPTMALTNDTGSSSSDNITSDAALTVSAAEADVTRIYTVDGGALSASYTAPTADGAHTVVITDTDSAGNTTNASLSFTLDNTIATPTVALSSDTGSSNSDHITSNAALSFSTVVADVTRSFSVDGGPSSGSYTAPTADGVHSVVVTDTDTAGNIASANLSFALDTTIATPTVVLTSDTGSSNSDGITSNAALTVSAVAADVTRSYTVDGGLASASYTAPTADGAHTVVVTDTDTAGNTANASLSFTLDNTIATPTVALTSDTGSSNSDHITSNAALSFSPAAADVTRTYTVDGGLASASYTAPTADGVHTVLVTDTGTAGGTATASISFTLDNTIATPTVVLTSDTGSSNSDGITSNAALTVSPVAADVARTYTVDGGALSASYTAPTAGGAHTVVVTDTDTAGNTANASLSFTLDNTIATPTVALTSDTGSSSSDHITSNATLSFSTAAADVTRSFSIDGGLSSASYIAPVTNGAHTVVMTDTDTAGNIANASISFTLDTTAPAAAVAVSAISSDTGASSTDFITNDTTLTVSGSNGLLGSGEKVQISTNGTIWVDATTVDATHWSYADPAIHGTSFTYQARVVDTAGNIGNSASQAIVIDSTADSAPTATVDITPTAITAAGESSVAYTIAGVDSDATASVTFTSSGGGSVTATGLGNGPHTVDLTPLHDGTVTASIALTDIAGNSATGIGDTATLNTSSGGVSLTGTSGPDTLVGTSFNDTLIGLGGNDILIGHGGNDNLQGGAGNDTFQYAVGDGADTISGGAGTDSLFITGTAGNDAIHVVASGSTLTGLEGGTITGVEHVYLDLGTGNGDALSYAGTLTNVTANLQTSNATGFGSIAGVENLTGGSGSDTLTGNSGDNVLDGGAGNDVISGLGGNDTLIGGVGNDTINAGSGNDVISGGDGKDTINYTVGSGVDTIDGGAGIDTLAITGTAGNDTINVVVSGSTITGLAGGSVVNVEKATIELLGGTGDTLSYVGTTSNVTVSLPDQTATGFTSIAGIENVTGGNGTNTLTGNSAANVLIGGASNDLISGGGGADTLTGGGGSDTFVYTALGNSRVAAFDTITDFTSGADKFQIGHALNGLTTGIVKTTGITGNLATDLASVLNTTNLKAKGAAEVTISSGADAGTYVVINDGTAGYNSSNDGVVKVIGSPVLHTTDFIV